MKVAMIECLVATAVVVGWLSWTLTEFVSRVGAM
jgi:hypothetical protein